MLNPNICWVVEVRHWFGEMAELEGREFIFNTPPHISQHSQRIPEKVQFWLEEYWKEVAT